MEPILLNLPDHFETERLFVRACRFGDGSLIHDAVIESVEQLRPWMPWAAGEPMLDNHELFARRAVASFALREQLHMLVFLRDSGEMIGSCGMNNLNWSVPHGQIGYWLRSSQTGRGYMSEAVAGWTQFAFSIGIQRVEIRCDVRNQRSAAVAERAGYQLEGTLRNDSRSPAGKLRDTRIFARLADERPS